MPRALLLSLIPLLVSPTPADTSCVRVLSPPVDAPISEPYDGVGPYAGHWGIDFVVPRGTAVGAAAPGEVVFAGDVVGVRAVTVAHGDGVSTTVSWLGTIDVDHGDRVATGERLGSFGGGHEGGLHFSVRVDGRYVDPADVVGCVEVPLSSALRLVP